MRSIGPLMSGIWSGPEVLPRPFVRRLPSGVESEGIRLEAAAVGLGSVGRASVGLAAVVAVLAPSLSAVVMVATRRTVGSTGMVFLSVSMVVCKTPVSLYRSLYCCSPI